MKNFEKEVIDSILLLVKKHQDFLCMPENLPQLAKLGYMYNTLWYAGRICWGHNGIIKKSIRSGVCEDNPKYKLEMCDPSSEEYDDLIYDAWGMHVDDDIPAWEDFKDIVDGNKFLTNFQIKFRKPNKTFDEWVTLLTSKEYKYHRMYPNRRSVANDLLCVIGNGYGYANGYIFREASGADQDIDLYGNWELAKFSSDIKKVVDNIMLKPEVQQTIETAHKCIFDIKEEKQIEREKWYSMVDENLLEDFFGSKKIDYDPYYPISNYSKIWHFDEKTESSYMKAATEICDDILSHNVDSSENIIFARNFRKKYPHYENIQ